MAGNIKGITIEFGADTTKLNGALKKTQGTLSKTQSELRSVNRSLKFNPGNTTLLNQKFKLLSASVEQTENKLKQLKQAQARMTDAGLDRTSAEYRQLEREIIKTENQLERASAELKRFGSIGKQQALAVGNAFKGAGGKIKSAGRTMTTSVSIYGAAGIYAGSKLIEMSQQQAQQEQKLAEIYKTRMGATKGAADETMKLASALQKQGVVGDEVALSFAQQMATYSSAPSTVNKLMPAFENLLVQQKGLNGTQEDAVGLANMFGKAMMGQTGALKRAGISFTDAQAEVLKYGTEEEKAAMVAEVITQNVGNMNAEFAKTDAGKIQQAKNALGDMGEEMGAILLPAVADLVGWFQENLMPKLQQFIDYMKEHPQIAKFALAFAAISAALGPVLLIIGALVSAIGGIITIVSSAGAAFSVLLGPVGLVVAAIGVAIAIGVKLYKNWDSNKKKLLKIWKQIQKAVKVVTDTIKKNFTTALTAIKTAFTTAVNAVKRIWSTVVGFFKGIWTGIKTAFSAVATWFGTLFSNAWSNIKKAFSTAVSFFKGIWTNIKSAFANVANWFGELFSSAWKKVKYPFSFAREFFSTIWTKIKDVFKNCVSFYKDLFSRAWAKVKYPFTFAKEFFSGIWDKIKGVFKNCVSFYGNLFSKAWAAVKKPFSYAYDFFKGKWEAIKNVFGNVKSWFADKFSAAWEAIKAKFASWGSFWGGLWDKIKAKFGKIGSSVASAISNSVKSGLNKVFGKIEGIINKGIDMINSAIRLANKLPGVNVSTIGHLSLPRLAKGAVLAKGQIGLIEGSGAEAVVPLERNTQWIGKVAEAFMQQMGAAQSPIVINVYGSDNMSVNELASAVERKLIQSQQRRSQAWA